MRSLARSLVVFVQSKRIYSAFCAVSLFQALFSLSRYLPPFPSHLSVALFIVRSSRSSLVSDTLRVPRTHSSAPPIRPSPPLLLIPLVYLSPSLAVVRVRISPISVDRRYTHASSPSLCSARARARARTHVRGHGGWRTTGKERTREVERCGRGIREGFDSPGAHHGAFLVFY